jgi:hypothetical protein
MTGSARGSYYHRRLVVNEAEASIVKLIYERYLELGWVPASKERSRPLRDRFEGSRVAEGD